MVKIQVYMVVDGDVNKKYVNMKRDIEIGIHTCESLLHGRYHKIATGGKRKLVVSIEQPSGNTAWVWVRWSIGTQIQQQGSRWLWNVGQSLELYQLNAV